MFFSSFSFSVFLGKVFMPFKDVYTVHYVFGVSMREVRLPGLVLASPLWPQFHVEVYNIGFDGLIE